VVQFPLQHAEPLVGQPAGVAPAQQLLALRFEDRVPDPQGRLVLRRVRHLVGVGLLQQIQPAPVALQPEVQLPAHVLDRVVLDVVVLLVLDLVEPVERGPHRCRPCLVALPRLVRLVRSQAQPVDQRSERQPLPD
jgi:hypothetical protein